MILVMSLQVYALTNKSIVDTFIHYLILILFIVTFFFYPLWNDETCSLLWNWFSKYLARY